MKTIDQLDLGGRRVFIRVDFNVPLKNGRVTENSRIANALPTIRHAIDAGARVVLASHLGRPKGEVRPEFSLSPAAAELTELLGRKVAMAPDCVGSITGLTVDGMEDGDIVLLENLRFHPEEEKNDPAFARQLAALADVYVNDAFGTAHRAHASTAGITEHIDEVAAGFLMKREVEMLSGLLREPEHPFVAIVGGAKVSDKIQLLSNMLDKVDSILIGGAMAYTFLKAQGHAVGASRVEEDRLELAAELLERAQAANTSIELPEDHIAAASFDEQADAVSVETIAIPEGLMGLDIGAATRARYAAIIAAARTVLWNGPMGVFEWDRFAEGTMAIAEAVADSSATSVVGGGDSVSALKRSGRSGDITHVSTGGGASLELLEGRTLPGIEALERRH